MDKKTAILAFVLFLLIIADYYLIQRIEKKGTRELYRKITGGVTAEGQLKIIVFSQPTKKEKKYGRGPRVYKLIYENQTFNRLRRRDKICFTFQGRDYCIILEHIGKGFVNISITNTKLKNILFVDIIKEFDLDGDGFNDLLLLLLRADGFSADLLVKLLQVEKMEKPKCECPECSEWSECKEGRKTRLCYSCGPETNFSCLAYEEIQFCEEKPKFPYELLFWIIILLLVILLYKLKKKVH